MSGIKRWYYSELYNEIRQEDHGKYVLHSDHEAVVDSMTAALVKLDGACLASEQEVARLRAEVENLHAKLDMKEGQRKLAESECASMRKDAERRLDLIRATLENTEWRHGARNIHAELCREVDAAMGASA